MVNKSKSGRQSFRTGNLLALAVMCLGAWIMIYPYLYAVGGSLKTRAEFSADKASLIPPRFRPEALYKHLVSGHKEAASERQYKEWPPQRNYVDAIIYGGIGHFLCNSFL